MPLVRPDASSSGCARLGSKRDLDHRLLRVIGEFDEDGRDLLPNLSELTPAMIALAIGSRIKRFFQSETMDQRLQWIEEKERSLATPRESIERVPHFCSNAAACQTRRCGCSNIRMNCPAGCVSA